MAERPHTENLLMFENAFNLRGFGAKNCNILDLSEVPKSVFFFSNKLLKVFAWPKGRTQKTY